MNALRAVAAPLAIEELARKGAKAQRRDWMRELALFAGAGGGILGGHLLGWRCVCAVEIDDYARRVLLARQRDGMLPHFPIWDDVTTFDGGPWRGRVDVVSGGFPCQDISAAGKGAGLGGSRSGLWSEFARIIGEVQPRHVFVENSPVLTSRGLGVVLGDLATLGYDARWGVIGACDVGAPHKRERIWIVADTVRDGAEKGLGKACGKAGTPEERGRGWERAQLGNGGRGQGDVADAGCGRCGGAGEWEGEQPGRAEVECAGEAVAYADGGCGDVVGAGRDSVVPGGEAVSDAEQDGCGQVGQAEPSGAGGEGAAGSFMPSVGCWWESEPGVGRVAHGVASRVDRLRCLGNGQVPAVAASAWRQLTMDN